MSDEMSRKDFFRSGLRSLFKGGEATPPPTPPRPAQPKTRKLPIFVRPPGAIEEALFLETCEGCGKCVEACHQDSIFMLPESVGAPLKNTPAIFSQVRPCFLCSDVPCSEVCPTGAIQAIPVEQIRIGTAIVDPERCLIAQGQECDLCHTACPFPGQAILLLPTLPLPLIDPLHCTGCGLCVTACPTEPSSITVYPTSDVQA